MKLEHKHGEQYRFSTVSVQHDGRDIKFSAQNGVVDVDNEAQAKALEATGKWSRLEEKEAPYALQDKTVSEVETYLEDIDDVERLKELRKLESEGKNRKNAVGAVDSRIEEIKQEEAEQQEVENLEDDESVEEDQEDGEETEDE